jgi:anti-anti-sigma factor
VASDLTQPFEIKQERVRDHACSLRLFGEFDLAGCEPFGAAFKRISSDGTRELAVDLTGLTFIDSSAIRALIDARNESEERGIRLLITMPKGGQVRSVLELTGVDVIFDAGRND